LDTSYNKRDPRQKKEMIMTSLEGATV